MTLQISTKSNHILHDLPSNHTPAPTVAILRLFLFLICFLFCFSMFSFNFSIHWVKGPESREVYRRDKAVSLARKGTKRKLKMAFHRPNPNPKTTPLNKIKKIRGNPEENISLSLCICAFINLFLSLSKFLKKPGDTENGSESFWGLALHICSAKQNGLC